MVPWQRELLDGIVKFIVIYSNIQCICIYIHVYIYIYVYIYVYIYIYIEIDSKIIYSI